MEPIFVVVVVAVGNTCLKVEEVDLECEFCVLVERKGSTEEGKGN